MQLLARLLRPLDTSEVQAALDEARGSVHEVQVRARALRMDVGCGDPVRAVQLVVSNVRHRLGFGLREAFSDTAEGPVPPHMQSLLDRLQ